MHLPKEGFQWTTGTYEQGSTVVILRRQNKIKEVPPATKPPKWLSLKITSTVRKWSEWPLTLCLWYKVRGLVLLGWTVFQVSQDVETTSLPVDWAPPPAGGGRAHAGPAGRPPGRASALRGSGCAPRGRLRGLDLVAAPHFYCPSCIGNAEVFPNPGLGTGC